MEEFFGESVYRGDHSAVRLLAYTARLERGVPRPTCHSEYRWASAGELDKYDFAPSATINERGQLVTGAFCARRENLNDDT